MLRSPDTKSPSSSNLPHLERLDVYVNYPEDWRKIEEYVSARLYSEELKNIQTLAVRPGNSLSFSEIDQKLMHFIVPNVIICSCGSAM